MEYIINLLQEHLRAEIQYRKSALDVINGVSAAYSQSEKAFEESGKIAAERIPQLERAIELLTREPKS